MAFFLPLVIAGVLGGWALLALVGSERMRRASEIDAAKAAAGKDAIAAANQTASASPATSATSSPAKPSAPPPVKSASPPSAKPQGKPMSSKAKTGK